MAGIHIAEARRIPYFRAFTMPWTRTSAYPQAFMVPAFDMGPSFNYSSYVLFDNIMWTASSGQINRWRKRHLHLKSTDMSTLSITKVPFLYNFSSAVVPKPLDWRDDITITGYWNLEDSDTDWKPPKGLDEFMKKARDDKKPLVYIVGPDDSAFARISMLMQCLGFWIDRSTQAERHDKEYHQGCPEMSVISYIRQLRELF